MPNTAEGKEYLIQDIPSTGLKRFPISKQYIRGKGQRQYLAPYLAILHAFRKPLLTASTVGATCNRGGEGLEGQAQVG